MTARILIVDGAPRASQEALVAHGGRRHGPNYAMALASQAKASVGGIEPTILSAADGADLPSGVSLTDFDGIAWTGSPLNAYHETPEVERQIAFARAAFDSGVPCFGSCWGLQVMAVALGGEVRLNPNGQELGIARAIALTPQGREHPMFAGKPAVFDALCVHQDEVVALPPGAVRLAGNAMSAVQAFALEDDGRSFWGVQYHPEYDLQQISAMFQRGALRLVEHGFARTVPDIEGYARDLHALFRESGRKDLAWRYGISTEILDPDRHRRELANWLAVKVAPRLVRRRLA